MAGPALRISSSRSCGVSSLKTSSLNCQAKLPQSAAVDELTALSVEFVAKPEQAESAPTSLPGAVTGALQEVSGFAGCLVMVSDQEARLITVVIFWVGMEAQKSCKENIKWVQTLLASYVDCCLRVKTMFVHLPVVPLACTPANTTDADLLIEGRMAKDENACAA